MKIKLPLVLVNEKVKKLLLKSNFFRLKFMLVAVAIAALFISMRPDIQDSERVDVKLSSLIKANKNLVAFWDFADSSGRPVAGSAKDVELISFGQTKRITEGPISGYSIELDGKTGYWQIDHDKTKSLDIKSNKVTVVAWVKWYGGTGFVAGKWNEHKDGGKRQYGLFVSLPYYNGANQVCGHISKTGGPTPPFPYSIDYSASPQKVISGQWTCVAFTYDGKFIKSYYNGKFQSREPELIKRTAGFLKDQPQGLTQSKNPYEFTAGIGHNGSDFTVGAVQLKSGMGNFFKGQIGGIAVFDEALTDSDMAKMAVMPSKH